MIIKYLKLNGDSVNIKHIEREEVSASIANVKRLQDSLKDSQNINILEFIQCRLK